jgi:hypothetical protein
VKALVKIPAGQNLLGVSSTLSWNEYATLWGEVHGVTCRFELLPGGVGEEFAETYEFIAEFGCHGGDPSVVLPKDVSVHSIPWHCGRLLI